NYRELRNFATRLSVESMDSSTITADMVRKTLKPDFLPGPAGAALPLPATNDDHEAYGYEFAERKFVTVILDPELDDLNSVYLKAAATFIEHKLNNSNGSLRLAARSLNTTHSTLSRILTKNRERSKNSPTGSAHNTQYGTLVHSAAA
ncbi:MAG: hypothetical protein ABI878_16230, partial [Acidobacteriota bacterium]